MRFFKEYEISEAGGPAVSGRFSLVRLGVSSAFPTLSILVCRLHACRIYEIAAAFQSLLRANAEASLLPHSERRVANEDAGGVFRLRPVVRIPWRTRRRPTSAED